MADAVLLLVKSGTETETVGDTAPMPVEVANDAGNPLAVTGSSSIKPQGLAFVGEFAPGVAAAQFPSKAGSAVRLKARAANAGKVYVGLAGVTKADGTTDATTGFELQAGDDTGWIPVENLNVLFGIGDGATDSVTYLVLS